MCKKDVGNEEKVYIGAVSGAEQDGPLEVLTQLLDHGERIVVDHDLLEHVSPNLVEEPRIDSQRTHFTFCRYPIEVCPSLLHTVFVDFRS